MQIPHEDMLVIRCIARAVGRGLAVMHNEGVIKFPGAQGRSLVPAEMDVISDRVLTEMLAGVESLDPNKS